MKRMSFALTEPQYLDGSKTVTRRLGWWDKKADVPRLEPGERFMGVRKGMGLKKGERQVELGPSVCVDSRRERLDAITPEDVISEGFPDMTPAEFVAMFCAANRCQPDTVITRIEFRRVQGD